MKKIIFTLALQISVIMLNAQSIRLFYESGLLNNNDTIQEILYEAENDINTFLGYQNTLNIPIEFQVRKEIININGQTTDLLFCLGECYTGNMSQPIVLNANETVSSGEERAFHAIYTGENDAALVKYTFFNTLDEFDKISFFIHYSEDYFVSVSTNLATDLSESSATLNGSISSTNATISTMGFQYRIMGDTNFMSVNAIGTSNHFYYSLSGLPDTLYEYRAFVNIAENSETFYGSIQTFEISWVNADTILIYDTDLLQRVSDRCNSGITFEGKYLKLMNNITLPLNQPNNMTSIGEYPDHPFKGTFDGNGMIITNLYIDHPNTPYQGFFGYTQNANLYEVGLVNITASGRNYTGGMVAYAENTYMRDCYVNGGTLYALSYCGGLVGYQTEGTNSIISGCYNTCNVSGNHYVGGLVGFSNYATVRNSYVAASVTGQGNGIGAIIGGANEVLMYHCYFNDSITGLTSAIGENNFKDNEGMTTAQMQDPAFVATLNQGLTIPVWKSDYAVPINNGFPILIWQYSGAEPCNAPSNLSASANGNSAILSWSGGENASYYTVEYGISESDVHSENTSNHQLVINNLQNGNYFWRVKSVCSFGESIFANGNTFTVGINDHNLGASMNVHPNPTIGIVNVECTMKDVQTEAVEFQLFDAFGRLLRTTSLQEQNMTICGEAQIDLSHYASGIYFVKAVADGKVIAVRKVIKN